MTMQPELPYGTGEDANSGWSGSATSEERARDADAGGTTAKRQADTLAALRVVREQGMTWRDLSVVLDVHHGGASGVLSVLHKVGKVARLSVTRERCKVYVLPEYVAGRETEPHGRTRSPGAVVARYEAQVEFTDTWVTIPATSVLSTPEEADAFIEDVRLNWPSIYGDSAWRVVELTSRTHHTLTY